MPSTSPSPSPLKTPELLQSILLCVDEQTLLVSAQRVSRRWRDAIATSPRLQKTLFLQPDESAAAVRDARPNPFLSRAFPFFFDDLLTARRPGERGVVWAKSDVVTAQAPVLDQPRSTNPIIYQLPQWPRLWTKRHAFGHPTASWRRMLVHQPPVAVADVLLPMQGGMPLHWLQLEAAGQALRMQDLLLSVFRQFRVSYDGQDVTSSELDDRDGEGGEPPNTAGFRVVWHLQEPAYAKRRRAVEEALGGGDENHSTSRIAYHPILVIHDVDVGSVAPLDRHFKQLKEILFPL
ncbi:hypothetical protein PG994_001744 [Apiospora phragmitis]|uniref:F-box domain-containing protein n=1 Tax=Apiospora phragmitis TaxID=2905665 RepID=A0ABR1WUA9_9PEZI